MPMPEWIAETLGHFGDDSEARRWYSIRSRSLVARSCEGFRKTVISPKLGEIYGKYGNLWEIYWKYMGNILEIYWKYMGSMLDIYGKYMGNIYIYIHMIIYIYTYVCVRLHWENPPYWFQSQWGRYNLAICISEFAKPKSCIKQPRTTMQTPNVEISKYIVNKNEL